MDLHPSGGYVFADALHHRIRRVKPDGNIVSIAGNGTQGYCGDGGPAITACLNTPHDVAMLADGSFLIADTGNMRIRYVSAGGNISTAAGNGSQCNYAVDPQCGNGRPGTQAPVTWPASVSANPGGGFYISEHSYFGTRPAPGPSRVRFVWNGTMLNWVGSGLTGYNGDSGQAQEIRLNFPGDAIVAPDGSYALIADSNNCKIRKLTGGGNTSLFAGAGAGNCIQAGSWSAPFSDLGDGGSGAAAHFNGPAYLSLWNGNLFVADVLSSRIRYLPADASRVDTVAGTASSLSATGDGGPATEAGLWWPNQALPFSYAGKLFFLISDGAHRRIRIVATATASAATLRMALRKMRGSRRGPRSPFERVPGVPTPGPRASVSVTGAVVGSRARQLVARLLCPEDPSGMGCVARVRVVGEKTASAQVRLEAGRRGTVRLPLRAKSRRRVVRVGTRQASGVFSYVSIPLRMERNHER